MTDLAIVTPYDASYALARRHADGWTRAEIGAALRALLGHGGPLLDVERVFGAADGLADALRPGVRL